MTDPINVDQLYQILPPMSAVDFANLKESIRETGGIMPGFEPIVDENGRTLDGHNRQRACAELGVDCPARTVTGLTDDEKIDLAWRANVPRRHLSIEARRELVRFRLRQHPERSNNAIGRELGSDDELVGRERRKLEATADIPVIKQARTGRPTTSGGRKSDESDDAETVELDRRENANHREETRFELELTYPAPSGLERTRGGIPDEGYAVPQPREKVPTLWVSGELAMLQAPPRTAEETRLFCLAIAERLYRRMLKKPLATMVDEAPAAHIMTAPVMTHVG